MGDKIKKIAIIMGSSSDEAVMKAAYDILDMFSIDYEVKVLSAHRMPNKTRKYACTQTPPFMSTSFLI